MDELNDLRQVINSTLSLVFKIGLLLVILAAFFLFTNLTTEIFDTPKFLVLLIFTILMLILLTVKYTISGKVTFIRTPLDIPLLLLLAVGIASTILSPAPYISLLGHNLKIHSSLVGLTTYVLFFFVLTNNLKSAKSIKWILIVTVLAAQILAVVTLIAYAGIKILPDPWTAAANFTPTGSSFSTSAILALLIPFVLVPILSDTKLLVKITNAIFLTIMGTAIALTGTWASWVGALAGLLLSIFVSNLGNLRNLRNLSQTRLISLIGLVGPIVIIALVIALSFIPPLGKARNPIYLMAQNFPREIQLGFIPSWKIAVSAFRDTPFWGTGPGTFSFNFTTYKPIEFNSSKVWNLRFDSAFNEYLQTLANLGGIGLIALLSLTALFISSAYKTIISHPRPDRGSINNDSELDSRLRGNDNKVALAISGLAFFIILALHASTLPLWLVGTLILASFMVISPAEGLSRRWEGLSNNLKGAFLKIASFSTAETSAETVRIDALPGVLLTISLALALFTAFFGGKMVLADYHHRLALKAVAANQGIVAYNELIAAEKLNPVNDLYRTDLAQVNFALANAIAAAKAPTEASPAGSLTDQDKQNIQVLLQQSINEGRTAVTLSPRSAVNWEILGMLYRQIAGVAQNALVFSLDSYGRAIFQDPLNPVLRLNVGGVYYAIKNYDLAIRFFTDAVNLKPDYANGYYNLSVALRDKGDLQNAKALAEKILTLVDPASPDYKTAQDYLDDLNNRIAGSETTGTTPAEPPAAKTSGALQEKGLPKVINLPKPEKIATPEAIKKPSPAPTPQP